MNLKYFLLMAVAIGFFSCNRTIVSVDKVVKGTKQSSGFSIQQGHESSAEASTLTKIAEASAIAEKEPQNNHMKEGKKTVSLDTISTKEIISRKELKRKIKEQQKVNKEMDPRLSRGLLMTIFGGIATTLGIVFMAYAPTGLFVFAFGIVFIVGLVTLIMYWSNPKPKM